MLTLSRTPRTPHVLLAFVVALAASGASLLACDGSSTETPAPANDAATDSTTSDSGNSGDGGQDAAPSDSTTTADASSQEKLICDAYASRSACEAGGALVCEDDDKCIYGKVMLPAAAAVYASCRGAPSCRGDDACVAEAGKSVGGAAADTYTADCLARRTACTNSFNDDYCSPAAFAFPGAGAGSQACLTQACDQIKPCIENLQALKDIEACK